MASAAAETRLLAPFVSPVGAGPLLQLLLSFLNNPDAVEADEDEEEGLAKTSLL